jgi:uncharacterized protein YacL
MFIAMIYLAMFLTGLGGIQLLGSIIRAVLCWNTDRTKRQMLIRYWTYVLYYAIGLVLMLLFANIFSINLHMGGGILRAYLLIVPWVIVYFYVRNIVFPRKETVY